MNSKIQQAWPIRSHPELGHHIFRSVTEAEVISEDAGVRLDLAVSNHTALGRPAGPPGTTVAIHMDEAAAKTILRQLYSLARSMDWPLPK
jgi:hypothetical protein